MTVYSNYNLVSDLDGIQLSEDRDRDFAEIDQKIGEQYPKAEFLANLFSVLACCPSGIKKTIPKILKKLKQNDIQKSLAFLAKKYYSKELSFRAYRLVRLNYENDYSGTDASRLFFRKKYEEDIQKISGHVTDIEGYPSLTSVLVGASVAVCSGLMSAVITGAATGALYKTIQTYRDLGDPPKPKPVRLPEPGLRSRVSRFSNPAEIKGWKDSPFSSFLIETAPSILVGTAVGACAFSGLVPALITGAAMGVVDKIHQSFKSKDPVSVPTILAGMAAGAYAFSSLAPILLTGVAAGVIDKIYKSVPK